MFQQLGQRYTLRPTPAGACDRWESVASPRQMTRHGQSDLNTVSTPARDTHGVYRGNAVLRRRDHCQRDGAFTSDGF